MLIKTLKRGTMLDDAPWVWGQEGGWTKDMPEFFQVLRRALRALAVHVVSCSVPNVCGGKVLGTHRTCTCTLLCACTSLCPP